MGQSHEQRRKRVRIGLWIPCGLAMAVVLAAVLYPVFAQAPRGPNATLVDGAGLPLADRRIRVRGDQGWKVVVTDAYGRFDVIGEPVVEGFTLGRIVRSSGSGVYYRFAPLARLVFEFRGPDGKPVEGEVQLRRLETSVRENSRGGSLIVGSAPANTPLRVRAADPARWKVVGSGREWAPGELTIHVTLERRPSPIDLSQLHDYGWQSVPPRGSHAR